MFRSLFALSTLALAVAPAAAANYSAKPAVPTTERIIARDIVWNCGSDACRGSTAESRPVVLCQSLAKRAGKVESFTVDGRAFSESELASCNSVAKDIPAKAVAAK